ncbi:hypothetical protein [Emticicia sp. BO119]|uniref:hypothetical protein n=1 Tax=Emticicia sp. BO119 TaxID=2757768 RepID=UPI0015F081E9|nr:hypothetical protein [Emticicia sp. BO119]MBA4852060.1 hypothetical protein [Emticicia sp. BO119]
MKPIHFLGQNTVYAKNQPEYQPLPGFKADSPQGEFISCWKLSFKERLMILFTGKLWVSLMTFNKPLTPSFFSVKKSDVLLVIKLPIQLKIKFFFEWYGRKYFGGFKTYLEDRVGAYVLQTTPIEEIWVGYKEEILLKAMNGNGIKVESPELY